MRILYVHHRAQVSGAARSLAELIDHLGDRWEAHVLTPAGPVATLFESVGAQVRTAPASLFQHTWDSVYSGRRWLLLGREARAIAPHVYAVRRLLQAGRYEAVHLNDSPLLVAGAAARRQGVPVVWHLRSSLSDRGHVVPQLIRRALERLGDHAFAIDEDVAQSFHLRIPTSVVFNSVTMPATVPTAAEARSRLGLPNDAVTIGFIGNLRRIKGWPEFVGAAKLLRDAPAHFVVVGAGVRSSAFFATAYGRSALKLGLTSDDETELRRLVEEAGLTERFTFLPFTDRIHDVYPALDIVTFPNQGHGLGRPVLEAAAHGKPSIAAGSKTGAGILLPGRTGILLPEATSDALAVAVRRLVADESLRSELGTAARLHAARCFDAGENASEVAEVYDSLIRSAGERR